MNLARPKALMNFFSDQNLGVTYLEKMFYFQGLMIANGVEINILYCTLGSI